MLKKSLLVMVGIFALPLNSLNATPQAPTASQEEKRIESFKELLLELDAIENPEKTLICMPVDFFLVPDTQKAQALEAEIAEIKNPTPEQAFTVFLKMLSNLTLNEPEVPALLAQAHAKGLNFLFYSLLPIEFLQTMTEHLKTLGIDLAAHQLTAKPVSLSFQDKKLALYQNGLLVISRPDNQIIQLALNQIKAQTTKKFDKILFLG